MDRISFIKNTSKAGILSKTPVKVHIFDLRFNTCSITLPDQIRAGPRVPPGCSQDQHCRFAGYEILIKEQINIKA